LLRAAEAERKTKEKAATAVAASDAIAAEEAAPSKGDLETLSSNGVSAGEHSEVPDTSITSNEENGDI
jgi:hypothetical protein